MDYRFIVLLILVFTLSATYGYSDDYQDGIEAFEQKDFKRAFEKLRPLAEKGMADAQYNLGVMYEQALGVKQDYQEAIRWWRLSAEWRPSGNQGSSQAKYRLGVFYDKGYGVSPDPEEAFKWYKLSAEQGNAEAQLKLGLIYLGRLKVAQDYIEAIEWFWRWVNNVW